MAITAQPTYIFGGTDSRSTPLNRKPMRALYCRNWAPQESGLLQLREGYSTVSQSTVTATAIHSLAPYKLWNGTRYLLYGQGTDLVRMNLATGVRTSIGTLSGDDFESAYSDNKVILVNGTGQKIYDGTRLFDLGVRPATVTDIAAVTVTEVLRQPKDSEASTVTVTVNNGGSFGTTSATGYQFYLHYLDVTKGYGFGPGKAISSRKVLTAGSKQFDIAILPDLSAVNANWKKLISRTDDGTSISHFCASGSKTVTAMAFNASTRVMTVTSVAHGFSTGDVVEITRRNWQYVATITVTDANTFTYEDLYHRGDSAPSGVLSDTVYKLVVVPNAMTTQTISVTTSGSLIANSDSVGLAASSVGGAQPGYEFAISVYNYYLDHPGNRFLVSGRIKPENSDTRAIFYLQGLPSLSVATSYETWILGRTGDGAEVPYIIDDEAGNWLYTDQGVDRSSLLVRDGGIDGDAEMPTENDVPVGLVQVARVGDRLHGRQANSPYVFQTPDGGNRNRVGKIEHSWFADSFETFPTGENTLCIAEYDHELIVWSANDVAILSEISGIQVWRGPWNLGIAGPRAFVNCPRGAFWVTGDKQLAKISQEGPVIVSDEYEKAELSRMSSTYLANTEIVFIKDASKGIEHLKIKCQDSDGNPFEVRHDFKLRDQESPEGQGYGAVYQGALASDYTIKQLRDVNGVMRVWCGAANGNLYQLEDGGTDGGETFTAKYVSLLNLGEETKSNPYLYFWGDEKVTVKHSPNLNTADYEAMKELDRQKVPGAENDFYYRVARKAVTVNSPEYFALELTSHADDAVDPTNPMALSEIPHLPVEPYGRVLGMKMELSDGRGQ